MGLVFSAADPSSFCLSKLIHRQATIFPQKDSSECNERWEEPFALQMVFKLLQMLLIEIIQKPKPLK